MQIHKHTRIQRDSERLFVVDAGRPMALLAPCPRHFPTPLRESAQLAAAAGVASVRVKDESKRMGLGSFKALGGAYAVAQMIRDQCELAFGMMIPPDATCSSAVREFASQLTFITASAGNHGLSVAAGARVFGANAAIVLSSTVPESFDARIEALGASVIRVDGNYEDSVQHAIDTAADRDWILLADGSWEGYIDPPALVVEGYTVMAEECRLHFEHTGGWPTHILLQAGVGGLACSFAAHVREYWPIDPQIIVVEPDAAPCLMHSVKAGQLTSVSGPESNMGRLDCKDASLIALDSLERDADLFVTVSDDEATAAAAVLGDATFPTTPSGGAGWAAITSGEIDGLDESSHCLIIVSEQV